MVWLIFQIQDTYVSMDWGIDSLLGTMYMLIVWIYQLDVYLLLLINN